MTKGGDPKAWPSHSLDWDVYKVVEHLGVSFVESSMTTQWLGFLASRVRPAQDYGLLGMDCEASVSHLQHAEEQGQQSESMELLHCIP